MCETQCFLIYVYQQAASHRQCWLLIQIGWCYIYNRGVVRQYRPTISLGQPMSSILRMLQMYCLTLFEQNKNIRLLKRTVLILAIALSNNSIFLITYHCWPTHTQNNLISANCSNDGWKITALLPNSTRSVQ